MLSDSERLKLPFAHKVETMLDGFLHRGIPASKITIEEWSAYAEGLGKLANPTPEEKATLLVDSLDDGSQAFDRIGVMVLAHLRPSATEETIRLNPLHQDLLRSLGEGEGLRYLVDLAAGRTQTILVARINELQRETAYFSTLNETAIDVWKDRVRHLTLFQTNLRHRSSPTSSAREIR